MNQPLVKKIAVLEKWLENNACRSSEKYLDNLDVLGSAYLEAGRHTEGIQCLLKLAGIKPSVKNYCTLGWAYAHTGDLINAGNYYEKAIKLDPESLIARSGAVDVCYRQGAYDCAFEKIQRIFVGHWQKKSEQCVAALRVYAKICFQFHQSEKCIGVIEKALNIGKLSKESRASLFYALAYVYDKSRNFESAYENFVRANTLSSLSYSHQQHRNNNNVLIKAFDASKIPSAVKAENRKVKPIFILGMPRSGTSLIEQILSRHKNVYAAGELVTITEVANVLHEQCDYPATLGKLSNDVLRQASNYYLDTLKKLTKNKKFITDKMPANFVHLGLISLLFPDAVIIHAQRNPMDICLSIYFQRFPGVHGYSSKLTNIAQYYLEYSRLMNHWSSVLSIQIHDVYYEKLVLEQENITRILLSECGLDWEPECLNFHKSERLVTTASQDQVKHQMYSTSVNRWENYNKFLPEEFKNLLMVRQHDYTDMLSAVK